MFRNQPPSRYGEHRGLQLAQNVQGTRNKNPGDRRAQLLVDLQSEMADGYRRVEVNALRAPLRHNLADFYLGHNFCEPLGSFIGSIIRDVTPCTRRLH